MESVRKIKLVLKLVRCYIRDILINELRVNIFRGCVYCKNNKLQVIFTSRITNYFLDTSYTFFFVPRVTSYSYCKTYKLLLIALVTSDFLHTSYKFIARVTF